MGVVLFALLITVSIYVVFTYPPDFGPIRWSNPAVWADNPKAAPPAWIHLFSDTRPAEHQVFETTSPVHAPSGETHDLEYVFQIPFTHQADEPPTFLSFALARAVYHLRPPVVTVLLERPDGEEFTLYREILRGPRPGESPPYQRHFTEPLRVLLSAERRAVEAVAGFLKGLEDPVPPQEQWQRNLTAALFGSPASPEAFGVLSGDYNLVVRVMVNDPADSVEKVRAVVGGSVFGALGTDILGRDLAEGLLFGLPVALLIGLTASLINTLVGTSLGLVSGYLGGVADVIIQRAADIVSNIPLLPLLIFMVFILGPNLWIIILILVAFSWPGLTIMVRTMVLQLRSGSEVEAAQALGASRTRIIFRHIFPHTAPFVFAQLVFFTPSAILAEAGLSFLGLGDPSIPTWGQILEHGFRTGAVFLGYWWWVIPPGLLIVLTAITFMFLALGMEPVVNPRLRRARSWRLWR